VTSDHPEYSGGAGWLLVIVAAALIAFVAWNVTARDDIGCDLDDIECVQP
jgi:hypothetical protein